MKKNIDSGKKPTSVKQLLPQRANNSELFKWGGTVGTVLGAISLGAISGTSFGPIGTTIGGILGAVGGVTVIATDTHFHKNIPR